MKKVVFVLLMLGLSAASGCSYLQPAADKIADGVRVYCTEPLQSRELIRATVNNELREDGHSVRVSCAGDPTD